LSSAESSPGIRLAAAVLAAGASRRMGSPKALLTLGARPLIVHLVETFRRVEQVDRIAIVTGHQPPAVRDALTRFDVTFVHNPDYDSGGMFSSVTCAIRALADGCDAFFVALLDQPLVSVETLSTMARSWLKDRPDVVVPAHDGKRGHPLLIAARCAGEILSQPAGSTLRDFVAQHRHNTAVVEVSDPGVLSCLDTPFDYQLVVNHWRTLTCPTVPAEPA
jgi:molybdenum cofactor cytidylyltransferase